MLSGRLKGSSRAPGRVPAGHAPPRTSFPTAGGTGYAVVDLEATGPSPRRHRVVEVAVVLLDRECRAEGEFSTLLDPGGPVGPTHIHGIDLADVGGAPRFGQIAAHVLGLLRGRVLVGHHVNCDRGFLQGEYARLGVGFPEVPMLCTMRLAGDYLPPLAGPSLRACCAAVGLCGYPAHTALGDARATAALLRHYALMDSVRPAMWSQALRDAARLEWPRMVSRGVPPTLRRGALAGRGANAAAGRAVPITRNGGA